MSERAHVRRNNYRCKQTERRYSGDRSGWHTAEGSRNVVVRVLCRRRQWRCQSPVVIRACTPRLCLSYNINYNNMIYRQIFVTINYNVQNERAHTHTHTNILYRHVIRVISIDFIQANTKRGSELKIK